MIRTVTAHITSLIRKKIYTQSLSTVYSSIHLHNVKNFVLITAILLLLFLHRSLLVYCVLYPPWEKRFIFLRCLHSSWKSHQPVLLKILFLTCTQTSNCWSYLINNSTVLLLSKRIEMYTKCFLLDFLCISTNFASIHALHIITDDMMKRSLCVTILIQMNHTH